MDNRYIIHNPLGATPQEATREEVKAAAMARARAKAQASTYAGQIKVMVMRLTQSQQSVDKALSAYWGQVAEGVDPLAARDAVLAKVSPTGLEDLKQKQATIERGYPAWLIPAGVGAVVLIAVAMRKGK